MWEALAIKTLVPIVAAWLIGQIANMFRGWLTEHKDKISDDAYEALEAGVANAEEDFVLAAKEAGKDGKLNKADRKKAEKLALKYALKTISNKAVMNFLLTMTAGAVSAWVKKILATMKK